MRHVGRRSVKILTESKMAAPGAARSKGVILNLGGPTLANLSPTIGRVGRPKNVRENSEGPTLT